MQEVMIKKAAELLENGTVNRVMGWKAGEFIYDVTPAVFETAEELKDLTGQRLLFAAALGEYGVNL